MMNEDLAMEVLWTWAGSRSCGARCARAPPLDLPSSLRLRTIGLFQWDVTESKAFLNVNTARSTVFTRCAMAEERSRVWRV